MKHWTKKCMVLFLCLCLAGCGSRTENYLASETETQVAKEQEYQETGEKETNGTVTVYVCGEVASPGVYVLEEGARIGDAVETAGGFTKSASRDYWNLAELLTDGQMIRFPTEEEAKEEDGDELGVSPGEYIAARKTERIKELLAVGEITTDDICEQLGFFDVAHLCKFFRKHTGMTMREWQKRNRRY